MKKILSNKICRILFFLILGFLLLLTLRVIYGYWKYPMRVTYENNRSSYTNWSRFPSGKNYASKKYKQGRGSIITVDQKYEKVATLSTRTKKFTEDEEKLRQLIKKYEMLIQFEQHSGLAGERALNLALGVVPKLFDSSINNLKTIGDLVLIQIDKSDKTNEYKKLNAKKNSLEKTRTSLIGFKGQGGKIEELIMLENRILEIENQIQNIGVNLGEFDEENEFCTVKITLFEASKQTLNNIPFFQRLRVALEWTAKYYALMLAALLLGLICVYIVLLIIGKYKFIQENISELSKSQKD